MKYLISPIQLGRLLSGSQREREKIAKEIINLFYIVETSDKETLEDHIKINAFMRKKRKTK